MTDLDAMDPVAKPDDMVNPAFLAASMIDERSPDIVEALKSLGYSQTEARDVLKQIPHTIEGTNARIKEALKILGGK